MTGTVELVGPDVRDLEPGQPVYISSTEMDFQSGCYDTMRLTPASAIVALPEGIDLEQASGLGYFALAWALLHETTRGFTPRSALIVGAAGGAGTALTQLARQAGMLVIGTVSSDEKAEFARSNGADHLVNYRTESVLDRVLEITKGRGVDLILDHVVGPHFADNFKMLDNWGTVVTYNATGGPPGEDFFPTFRSRVERSPGWRSFSLHSYEDDPEGRRRILSEPLQLLAEGRLKTHVAARFAIDDIREAHALLESGRVMGKIVLTP